MNFVNKKTILLVEDESIIAMTEKKDLEKYGYAVIIAYTGEEAVKTAKATPVIDLILMDIDLGKGIDGIKTAEIILKTHDIPIVFISNHIESEIVKKTEKISSYGYVVKSSDITVLDASIKIAFRLFGSKINAGENDITKRKKVEEALIESEDRFRSLFEQSPIGIAYHEMLYNDSGKPIDYRFLDANASYRDLTGFDPRDRLVTQAFPGIEKDPFDWIGTFGHVARTGEQIRFEQYLQPNDRWYDCVAYQFKPDHFVAVYMEITERKRAEQALLESKDNQVTLNNLISQMIDLPDLESIYQFITDSLQKRYEDTIITFISIDELKKETNFECVSGLNNSLINKISDFAGFFSVGKKYNLTTFHHKNFRSGNFIEFKDGLSELSSKVVPYWAAITIEKLIKINKIYTIGINKGDNLLAAITFITLNQREIDDSIFIESFVKQAGLAIQKTTAETKIKSLLIEKETLLKEVHHRIKNNIASIEGLLLIQLQTTSNPQAVSAIQDAAVRVQGMRILYDKLLITSDYQEISCKTYIESLVNSIVKVVAENDNITIEKQIMDFNLDTRFMFPIGIIINELLTNVFKYGFKGIKNGRISISLCKTDNHVNLTIQDNGVGIDQNFDFNKSSGFGLSIVKMLNEQLGGTFTIENHNGTRIVLMFDI